MIFDTPEIVYVSPGYQPNRKFTQSGQGWPSCPTIRPLISVLIRLAAVSSRSRSFVEVDSDFRRSFPEGKTTHIHSYIRCALAPWVELAPLKISKVMPQTLSAPAENLTNNRAWMNFSIFPFVRKYRALIEIIVISVETGAKSQTACLALRMSELFLTCHFFAPASAWETFCAQRN